MKLFFTTLFIFFTICANSFSFETKCGKAVGFSYNQDTIESPYKLSGFFIKQNTIDIRVTFGNSPIFIEEIENVLQNEGNIFVCIDDYKLIIKTYARQNRVYAVVDKYRVWLDGELLN